MLSLLAERGAKKIETNKVARKPPYPLLSGGLDSNQRPLAPHTSALPGCATTRTISVVIVQIPFDASLLDFVF